jgi:hypothetical protein
MADDPNPALRAELTAALGIVAPQIRGLRDLTTVSISPDLVEDVNNQITSRERRRDLIQAVLTALDHVVSALKALEADGYPDLKTSVINPTLFTELQGERTDLEAAVAIFTQELNVGFNQSATVTDMPQPVPQQTP